MPGDGEITDIVVSLDEMLAERGVTLTQLAEAIGITLANASILKTGKARAIRFSTLSAICRELNCQPGDLLSYKPADTNSTAPRRIRPDEVPTACQV
jgi:putative transcriptional regulator